MLWTCQENKTKAHPFPQERPSDTEIEFAEGFRISKHGHFSVLEIQNPWPGSELSFKYALIDRAEAAKTSFMRGEYDGIILTPVEKIVVTSTTHIPALELLGVEQSLVGFPETQYISSEKTRLRIDEGLVRDLGPNESLNTEVLLSLKPEVIVAFGVDGKSKSLNTIRQANIPVIYNGDWVEKTALAKAEWIKFFAALYNKEADADAIFNSIKTEYQNAKKRASIAKHRPTILSGALHKDQWGLPGGASFEAQFLKDANTNYLWAETPNKGSLSLNFEVVLNKAAFADIWLSPSYHQSLKALENASAHHTKFDAYKNKQVYSFSNTTGKTGGVLYYELGVARPDLILKDLIKICHPELMPDYKLTFFKALE